MTLRPLCSCDEVVFEEGEWVIARCNQYESLHVVHRALTCTDLGRNARADEESWYICDTAILKGECDLCDAIIPQSIQGLYILGEFDSFSK